MYMKLIAITFAVVSIMAGAYGLSRDVTKSNLSKTSSLTALAEEQGLGWARKTLEAALAAIGPDRGASDRQTGLELAKAVQDQIEIENDRSEPVSTPNKNDCGIIDIRQPGVVLISDSMNIRIFEQEIQEQGTSGDQPIFFERLDLSGIYDVTLMDRFPCP